MTDPTASSSPLPSKETIVEHLLSVLNEGILKWCEQVDLNQLCANSHKQLLELKVSIKQITHHYFEFTSCLLTQLFLEKDNYFSKQTQLKEKV